MVITQGADPVIVVQNGEVTLYDVTKLAADKIVDTNGAGNYYFFNTDVIRQLRPELKFLLKKYHKIRNLLKIHSYRPIKF